MVHLTHVILAKQDLRLRENLNFTKRSISVTQTGTF